MSGHEEREDLVDLLVAHPLPVILVANLEQPGQEVGVIGRRSPARVDHPLDRLVEESDRLAQPPPRFARDEDRPFEALGGARQRRNGASHGPQDAVHDEVREIASALGELSATNPSATVSARPISSASLKVSD